MEYHKRKVADCYNTLNKLLEDHNFMIGNCVSVRTMFYCVNYLQLFISTSNFGIRAFAGNNSRSLNGVHRKYSGLDVPDKEEPLAESVSVVAGVEIDAMV